MRTIIWFIYFWGYLLLALPKMKKAQRLEAAGDLDARDALVEPKIQSWARSLDRKSVVEGKSVVTAVLMGGGAG